MPIRGFYSVPGTYFHSCVYQQVAVSLFLIYITSAGTDSLVFSLTKAMRQQGTGKLTQVRTHVRHRLHTPNLCVDNEEKTSDNDHAHRITPFLFLKLRV